ncbi:hypothetical protein K1719_032022 [Acacia pycnantha]|nr:hypothetical protein K1719_032022 [Acacia pycnantha]
MWLGHENFNAVMDSCWSAQATLMENLPNCMSAIKEWNRNVFGNVANRKNHILGRLKGIQSSPAYPFSRFLCSLELNLQKELDEVLRAEEIMWFQKSRAVWISKVQPPNLTPLDPNSTIPNSHTIMHNPLARIGFQIVMMPMAARPAVPTDHAPPMALAMAPMQLAPIMVSSSFAKDAIISWFHSEIAAANIVIDALYGHRALLSATTGASDYDSVFSAIHRRRLNWIPVIQMQKYHSTKSLRRIRGHRKEVT